MENEAVSPPTNQPSDVVGTNLFGMYSDGFKQNLNDLTKGELKRLVRALCLEGMEDPEFGNDFSPRLPSVIALAKAMVEAKFVMSMNAAIEAENKKAAELAAATAAESATQPEGNENGEANS